MKTCVRVSMYVCPVSVCVRVYHRQEMRLLGDAHGRLALVARQNHDADTYTTPHAT